MTCENALSKLWRSTPRHARIAFFSALAIGLMVYLYAFTNRFFCVSDALNNVQFDGNLVWLGRFSSEWLSSFSTDLSIPALNGMLMLLAVSMLAALTVTLLELRSGIHAFLAAAVLVCHPAVGNTLKYLHNADAYMIAAMLAALGLLLIDRTRLGWLPGICLMTLATGTYQANASLVLSLMFVRGMQLLVQGDMTPAALCKKALRYALCFGASLALYYALAQLFSRLSGLALSSYQSVNALGQLGIGNIFRNIAACYADFKAELTYLSYRPQYYVSGYANYLIVAAGLGLSVLLYVLNKQKTALKSVALALLMLLSPLLMCSIRAFGPDSVHKLMTYSLAGVYLLALTMLEQLPAAIEALRLSKHALLSSNVARLLLSAVSWALIICIILCVFVWVVGINLDYYQADLDYESMYAQCTAYLAMAEQADGYTRGMPIYIIGSPGENAARRQPALGDPKSYYAFMVHVLDADMPFGIANSVNIAANELKATDAFTAMPCYPQAGCALMIDGAMVVKLSN